jgi:hypothetical protein
MNKIEIEGIILVISCQKHKNTRLNEFRVPFDEYNGWKVIYVIGNIFLEKDFELNGNLFTINCEDSYLHLLKKLILSIKYLYNIFNIKQGILRSGDDLYYNESNLIQFLDRKNKPHYYGTSSQDFLNPNPEDLKNIKEDFFMVDYYSTHKEDFENPLHNIKNIDISKYVKRPKTDIGAGGNLFYISNKSCKILVDHMENIDFNIYHFDNYTQSYPYIIEDCAVAFILYFNKIGFKNSNIASCTGDINDLNVSGRIGVSTDKYK